jgi:pantetheine-phosphate adenylyltransferase
MSERRVAVYPASFDPITNGHLDLIDRSARLFDEVIVAVAKNLGKAPLFTVEERVEMICSAVAGRKNVRVETMDGLLVDYVREHGSRVVIRGLRALADFEYEFEMAMMNAHMYPQIETVFLMTSAKWFYVSSSRLRELVRLGGDVSDFVPPLVSKRLQEKLAGASLG